MLTTWKKELPTGDKENRMCVKYTVEIPIKAQIAGILIQKGEDGKHRPVVWFDCDDQKPLVPHTFFVSGTGYNNDILKDEVVRRVGLFQHADEETGENWVWHVWHKPFGH